MKRIIFFIGLFLLISTISKSEEELPFQNSRWTYLFTKEYESNLLCFYTQGDTIVDDVSRTKLYKSDNLKNESHLIGLLHEADKKVYFRYLVNEYEDYCLGGGFFGLHFNRDTDYLIYDFSLGKGDEFTLPIVTFDDEKLYVYDVDEIEIGGKKRKRFAIKNRLELEYISTYWIEGMGDVHGLFYSGLEAWPTCECSKSFICYSENGETLYLNPSFDDCPEIPHYFKEEFSFTFYFEDAIGNKDQVTVGYDANATRGIDPEFGEENIIDTPFDEVFDVRVGVLEVSRRYPYVFLTKKQIMPKSCGEIVDFPYYQEIYVHCKNFPITISWDPIFNEECNEYTFLVDWDSGGWWDAVHGWEQGPFFMKDVNSISLPYLNKERHTVEYDGKQLNFLYFSICSYDNFGAISNIEDLRKEDPFQVYITESGLLHLNSSENIESVSLINTAGVCCLDSKGSILDISSLPKGVYIVKIITKERDVPVYKKINKQ